MTISIKDMHYQFKSKLNKIDSVNNVNYRVPEIDWKLRIAEREFIKERISQSNQSAKGTFGFNNKVIDDLKSIIVQEKITDITVSGNSYTVELPDNYFYFIECYAECTKNGKTKLIRCYVRNSNEEIFIFNQSSFEWEEINIFFEDNKIILASDSTFTIGKVYLKYIKIPVLMHNAEDYYGTVSILGSDIKAYYNTYNRVPKGLTIPINSVVDGTSYSLQGYTTLDKQKLFGYIDSELSYSALDDLVESAVNETEGISNSKGNEK